MIVGKKEKKLQFHYVVQAQYEHRTAAETHKGRAQRNIFDQLLRKEHRP